MEEHDRRRRQSWELAAFLPVGMRMRWKVGILWPERRKESFIVVKWTETANETLLNLFLCLISLLWKHIKTSATLDCSATEGSFLKLNEFERNELWEILREQFESLYLSRFLSFIQKRVKAWFACFHSFPYIKKYFSIFNKTF